VPPRRSHAKFRRVGPDGEKQTIVVPVSDHLAIGTLHSIVQEASNYLTHPEIMREFYTN
jgi:predicted RNA binding protein YcfA (HicA-like mRNA interferase family)